MIRTSPLRLFALVAAIVLLASCASYTASTTPPPPSRTPYEQANLNFAAAAADYKVALQVVKDLRRARLLTDSQWADVESADKSVKEWAPIVHELLELWGKYGERPGAYYEANDRLTTAYITVAGIKDATKKGAR